MQNNTLARPGPSLSGTALKRIACLSMLIDHIGAALLENGLFRQNAVWQGGVRLDFVMRMAGRLAFPIYCFLLVEPYALRTYGSEIPQEELAAFTELMHNPDRIDDFCKADDDFHELLMSTLPNKYLRSAYDRITGLNTRFRIMTGKVSMINREQTCEEHLEILDAATKGDWNTAADALQKHLEIARDKAEGVIKVIRLW